MIPSQVTIIRVQNISLSASIDDLIGHLTSDREEVAPYSVECSHDNPSRKVATITFIDRSIRKEALRKDKHYTSRRIRIN